MVSTRGAVAPGAGGGWSHVCCGPGRWRSGSAPGWGWWLSTLRVVQSLGGQEWHRKTTATLAGRPAQGLKAVLGRGASRLGEVAAGDRASVATVVSQFLHPGAARGDLSRTTRPLSAQRYLVQTSLSDSVAQTIARKMCSGQCAWVFHPLGSGLAIRERASSHRCGQQHQQSKLFASTPRSDAKRPTKVGLVFFFPPCYLQISLF